MSSFSAEMTLLLLSHSGIDANTMGKVQSFLWLPDYYYLELIVVIWMVQERSFRLACEEGNLDIVRVFLARGGFDINAQNKASLFHLLCHCWVL